MSIVAPTPDFLDGLRDLLGPSGWRDGADAAPWLDEPRGKWSGLAAIVARPANTGEVAEIVRRCAEARVAVVPRAGGTGLVGGQTLVDGPPPVVLSLDRMTAIRSVDAAEDALVAEAGVILEHVHAAAEAADRLFPLSLASKGSARVGGLLSTNAGGVGVLRYGNARDLTLGIEAVLPDGSVLHGLKTLRKDNTGYDLRHLLIGSEGTLGVITAAALRLFPRPRETATAWVAVASPEAACALLPRLRDRLGGAVSAFELIGALALDFIAQELPDAPAPPLKAPWMVLAEASGGAGARVGEALEEALAEALEAGAADDAVIAQNEAQAAAFWRLREEIPQANRRVGAVASHDVAVPLAALPRMVREGEDAVRKVSQGLRVNCFGHVGDGNLHFNVFPPDGATREDFAGLAGAVTRAVHDLVDALGGSVSAEHGLGRLKADELVRYGDPAKLRAMRAIKAALDPAGVMNPGAVLAMEE
ncbi:FAD-binding oxidoreductase [Rubrimonas cliftonensis]|uniref:FAD/FMN-containing dehydrogenase n=1 Tax=Rubrimonas cliftonensis TaxID=89524 RepID=A0A1H3Z5J6_9RHOB|nr:FAD-binding oxidoreductase [Rubrimonas cliftonensis]SEA18621.1 FAD/FMN-containing dehydrogenase [Rubrimonas cliftonensis]